MEWEFPEVALLSVVSMPISLFMAWLGGLDAASTIMMVTVCFVGPWMCWFFQPPPDRTDRRT
jgi:hypothetical protein